MSGTREYPVVSRPEAEPERMPVWAVVVMTLAVLVNVTLWPVVAFVAWERWHG